MIYISSTRYPGAITTPRFPSFSWETTTARKLLAAYTARDEADLYLTLLFPLAFLRLPFATRAFALWTSRYDAANSTILVLNSGF